MKQIVKEEPPTNQPASQSKNTPKIQENHPKRSLVLSPQIQDKTPNFIHTFFFLSNQSILYGGSNDL